MYIKLEKFIDSGSYSDVWQGIDILDRKVAVKVLRRSSPYYFDAMAHAKALARTQHPNIVTVFSLETVKLPGAEEELDGVVMEFIEGQTLQSKLEQELLDAKEAKVLCEALINGLEHIHASGMVHNDLHSKNVLIANQRLKIIDILYTDSLSKLTTTTREEKIRRDKRDLTTLLFDIVQHTKLETGAIKHFGLALQDTTMSFAAMHAALQQYVGNPAAPVAPEFPLIIDQYWESLIDSHFVNTPEYVEALNQKFPDKAIRPLLERAITEQKINDENLLLIQKMWARLLTADRQPILDALSNALSKETPDGNWGPLLKTLNAIGPEQWNNLPLATRLRLEALLIKDIKNGYLDVFSKTENKEGLIGTWAVLFGGMFQNRDNLIVAISEMLMKNWYTQNYIARYLFPLLPLITDTPDRKDKISKGIKHAISNEAVEAKKYIKTLPKIWLAEIGLNEDGTPKPS